MTTLDLTALPSETTFGARPLLAPIDDFITHRLSSMPELFDRARSAVMHAESASKMSESWLAAADLRAALADFVSMEEVQTLDRPAANPFKIRASKLPLVHLLALMRHLNIHVKNTAVASHSVQAQFQGHDFQMHTYVISNLDASDLKSLQNGKHYAPTDLEHLVSWFNSAQGHWGAGYLVRIGTEAFANEIAAHQGC